MLNVWPCYYTAFVVCNRFVIDVLVVSLCCLLNFVFPDCKGAFFVRIIQIWSVFILGYTTGQD